MLKIQESTIKRHIYNLFNKVGADSRTQLIFLLMQ
ncbi:MAG: response regulator transcription factor [Spirochaetaceae bacterium]|nr:response regulator transcription factor [Spirochaetaceae bacterium]